MGSNSSMPQMEQMAFEPPSPVIQITNPNKLMQWQDLAPLVGQEALQNRQINSKKHLNKIVHWIGQLVGADQAQNALLFKMNPSYTNDPKRPDVVLSLSRPLTCDLLAPFVGKQIDFTAKISQVNQGQVVALFANYDIYGRADIPQPIQQALKTNALSAANLATDLQGSPAWHQVVMDTYPVTIQKMFGVVAQNQAVVTCEVVKVKSPKELLVKTNPPAASSQMESTPVNPAFDILVQLAPTVALSPLIKPGSVISIFGKHQSMDNQFVITFACNQITPHSGPNADLSKLPTQGAKISFTPETMANIQKFKAFGDGVSAFLTAIRSQAPASSGSSPSIKPPMIRPNIGVPVIRPPGQVGIPVVKPTKPEDSAVNAVQEPAAEKSQSQTPVAMVVQPPPIPTPQQEPEKAQQPTIEAAPAVVQEPQEANPPAEVPVEDPNKPAPIYDENGKVKLDEPKNEFTGRDVTDVAMELMKAAPKANYTQTAIMSSFNEDEDDALRRVRMLKQSGIFQQFEENADKHLDELAQFAAKSKDPYAATQDYYGGGAQDYYGAQSGGAQSGDYYGGQSNDYYGGSSYNSGGNDYASNNYGSSNYGSSYGGNDYGSSNYGGYGTGNNGW